MPDAQHMFHNKLTVRRRNRRYVRRACNACRLKRTKCSGDPSGCERCVERSLKCEYSDSKREESQKKNRDLFGKVRYYEDIIEKLSDALGTTSENLLNRIQNGDWNLFPTVGSPNRTNSSLSSIDEQMHSKEHYLGHYDSTDDILETVNTVLTTGHSPISWLSHISKKLDDRSIKLYKESTPDWWSCSIITSPDNYQHDTIVSGDAADLNQHITVAACSSIDEYCLPPQSIVIHLIKMYCTKVHPSFPVIEISSLLSRYRFLLLYPSVKPDPYWLALLNSIFALSALHLELDAQSIDGLLRHDTFMSQARAWIEREPNLYPPNLASIQVGILVGSYYLATGELQQAHSFVERAVDASRLMNLTATIRSGHRNNIHWSVWCSLYAIEHCLDVMTGNVPQLPDAGADLHQGQDTPLAPCVSFEPFRTYENVETVARDDFAAPQLVAEELDASWGNSALPKNVSLYLHHLVVINKISKQAVASLYKDSSSPGMMESDMLRLLRDTETWQLLLPLALDMETMPNKDLLPATTRSHASILALNYYSTRILITWPALNLRHQCSARSMDNEMLADHCLKAALGIVRILPDPTDCLSVSYQPPWWLVLTALAQATAVLMMELYYQVFYQSTGPVSLGDLIVSAKTAIEYLKVLPGHWKTLLNTRQVFEGLLGHLTEHDGTTEPYTKLVMKSENCNICCR